MAAIEGAHANQGSSDPADLSYLVSHLRELPEEAKKYLTWAAFFGSTWVIDDGQFAKREGWAMRVWPDLGRVVEFLEIVMSNVEGGSAADNCYVINIGYCKDGVGVFGDVNKICVVELVENHGERATLINIIDDI